jgi:RNA polymerase sigma factor (sigma-70 family)
MTVFSTGARSRLLERGDRVERVDAATSVIDVAALYREHRLSLARIALLLVDDMATAEDVVHDSFIALQQNAHKLRNPSAALAYLRTTVVNKSRSLLRKRQTVRKHLALARDEHAEAADSELMLATEHQEVLAAVRQLPQRQQEVLALRYWSNLSEAEIADALGISRGAVKSNASRGMDKLEAILGASR